METGLVWETILSLQTLLSAMPQMSASSFDFYILIMRPYLFMNAEHDIFITVLSVRLLGIVLK